MPIAAFGRPFFVAPESPHVCPVSGARAKAGEQIPAAAVKPDVRERGRFVGNGGRTQSDERERLLAIAERSQRTIENHVMADKQKPPRRTACK